MTISFKVF